MLFLSTAVIAGPTSPILSKRDIYTPVQAAEAMVVTAEPLAAAIGLDVLKNGGNAVDAAVTIGFVMAVTHPQAGNIGGGGFMLIYSAKTQEVVALDYRETAPALATRDMYLDESGNPDKNLSRFSPLSSGVPGTVAGLALALEKYGTLSLPNALAPAIRLAEEGFTVSAALGSKIKSRAKRLKKNEAASALFFHPDGSFYQTGEVLYQKELAKTLREIAENGIEAFYEGKIAERIVAEMERGGGLITREDLGNYRPVIRRPVKGTYRGYEVYSMSPPSSGGIHIVQILNTLEGYDIGAMGHNSAETIHHMAEAMKRAYADRSKYLGDPDFVNVPETGLTDKSYAAKLRKKIKSGRATKSEKISPGVPPIFESNETTHFSVVDSSGNAVSNTYTLNFSFGSGIAVEGAGFLLNNEMDDFSAKPGVPNAYGLIGGAANAIEPGKRMLSSMSPTIVLKDGRPFIVTGSPGGARIITTTLQVIMNVVDHGMNIQEAVNAPRIHHQWLPDELRIEEGINPDTVELLKHKGHKVVVKDAMGAAGSILVEPIIAGSITTESIAGGNGSSTLYGATDPRRTGAAVGY